MGVAEGSAPESYVIALLAEGRHQAAFDAIAEFGPSRAYAPHFANLGYRLWRAGRAADATQVLERALHLDPALASAWLTLAMLKLSQQQLQEGARCLDEALARAPQMAAGFSWTGSGPAASQSPMHRSSSGPNPCRRRTSSAVGTGTILGSGASSGGGTLRSSIPTPRASPSFGRILVPVP